MSRPVSPALDIPRKSVELEDPGAHELSGSEVDEDDVFQDAAERPAVLDGRASPIPKTRVEKVDDNPSYGDIPGTTAYEMRLQDAVPDEMEIVPDGQKSRRNSTISIDRPATPGGTPIPMTVVEKVDPEEASHGDVPGTHAHKVRQADAVPDVILKAPEAGRRSPSPTSLRDHRASLGPIPLTVISRVDTEPIHREEAPATTKDLTPTVDGGNTQSSPTSSHMSRSSEREGEGRGEEVLEAPETAPAIPADARDDDDDHDQKGDNDDTGFGDEFDDFEEGDNADDDFGDFDAGFQEPGVAGQTLPLPTELETPLSDTNEIVVPQSLPPSPPAPSFSLPDYPMNPDLSTLTSMTASYLSAINPPTLPPPSPPVPISTSTAIFTTPRSLSLWNQLVTPPPLQPPNWIQSRIRRLFLVSLGVPVDLDEILPKSKQQKLVLPSMQTDAASASSASAKVKQAASSSATTAAAAGAAAGPTSESSRATSSARRGMPAPPTWDALQAKQLASTTDEALDNMTGTELSTHVQRLEVANGQASRVLEYWLKCKDDAVDANETWMLVLENSVKHFRKIRR